MSRRGSAARAGKARILAIFDDLDTILLMVPLKVIVVGMRWELSIDLAVRQSGSNSRREAKATIAREARASAVAWI